MADPNKRAGRLTAIMGLSGRTLLLVAVIGFLIAAAYRLHWRSDWSYFGNFTLHPELQRIIEQQGEAVTITAVGPASDQQPDPRWFPIFDTISQSLRDLCATSDQLDLAIINPDIDLPELQAFEQAHGQATRFSLYLHRAGRQPYRVTLGRDSQRTLQRDIGAALVALEDDDRVPVYFLTGHGELNPGGTGPDGCSAFHQATTRSGYDARVLRPQEIDRLGRLPDDGVVVIAGPTAPLGADLIAHLQVFLRDGGNLLVLADHRCPADLAGLLRLRGIMIGPGIPAQLGSDLGSIFDPAAAPAQPMTIQSATESMVGQDQRFDRLRLGPQWMNPGQEVSNAIRVTERDILSPRSTPIIAVTGGLRQALGRDGQRVFAEAGTPPFQIEELILIDSEAAWLTLADDWTTPAAKPEGGARYLILCAATYEAHSRSVRPGVGARIMAWGSREAASDEVLRQGIYANEDLLGRILAWLAQQEPPTTIPPADYAPITVDASDGQMQVLFAILVIILPMLCIGGAMVTWWERR